MSADEWADCWICRRVFRRKRPTARRCKECSRPFCEGEHGSFAHQVGGICLQCDVKRVEHEPDSNP